MRGDADSGESLVTVSGQIFVFKGYVFQVYDKNSDENSQSIEFQPKSMTSFQATSYLL